MSEQIIKYRYEADVGDAVANVGRFKSELASVSQVLREGSYATEETISSYTDFRKEINLQSSAIRTAQQAWRVQHYDVEQTLLAFNRVSAIGRTLMNTFETFTMASFRLESAQRDLRNVQTRLAEAQIAYNKAVGESGPASSEAVAAADRLRNAQNQLEEAQMRVTQIQQQNTLVYVGFALQIPSIVYNIYGIIKALELAKITTAAATVVEWFHNAALSTKIVLLSALTAGAFAVAAAIGAAAGAAITATAGMNNYNAQLGQAVSQTEKLINLNTELARMCPIERLQREYTIVKEYYEARIGGRETSHGTTESPLSVSIGTIEVSAANLGSPLDRDRTAEDIAKTIGHKLALRVIPGR